MSKDQSPVVACNPNVTSTIRKFECDTHDGQFVHQHDDFLILSFRSREADPLYKDTWRTIELSYDDAQCLVKLVKRACENKEFQTLTPLPKEAL